jgi:hypothetical protein
MRKKKVERMPIPNKIKVGDKWYKIEKVEVIAGCKGDVTYEDKTIRIASRSANYAYTADEQINTFWHELTHTILKDMDSKLEADELFVTAFADRLHNAVKSAKFEE